MRKHETLQIAILSMMSLSHCLHGGDYFDSVATLLLSTEGKRIDFVVDGIRRENATFVSVDKSSNELVFLVEGTRLAIPLSTITSLESITVCSVCNGNGSVIGNYDYSVDELVDCPSCVNGKVDVGYVYKSGRPYYDDGVRHSRVGHAKSTGWVKERETCKRCNGTGKIKVRRTKNSGPTKEPCKTCNGRPKVIVNVLQNAFLSALKETLEMHIHIEKSRRVYGETRKLYVTDASMYSMLSSLMLDWYAMTDSAERTIVLVEPVGTQSESDGGNIDVYRLATLPNGDMLATRNRIVAAYIFARKSQDMNAGMRNGILSSCVSKINGHKDAGNQ